MVRFHVGVLVMVITHDITLPYTGAHAWPRYAFPPLLTDVIKGDIHASTNEIANSNIIALLATYVFAYPHAGCD